MTRLVLVAAVFVLAACSTREQPADTARVDTAPALAPAPTDTSADTTKRDTTKADTTKAGTKKTP